MVKSIGSACEFGGRDEIVKHIRLPLSWQLHQCCPTATSCGVFGSKAIVMMTQPKNCDTLSAIGGGDRSL
jgi:hypothetical protein